MGEFSRMRSCARSPLRFAMLVVWSSLALALPAYSQVSPEEHQKHHPGQNKVGPSQGMGSDMEDMGGMMEGMGKPSPRELYPSLMTLPELTRERREELIGQAHARMQEGTRLFSRGLDQLAEAAEAEDDTAMQAALAQVREGLERFDSGLAARRALATGRAPRTIALQWFKQEMNLLPPTGERTGFRLWGMTSFHAAIMASLLLFAAVMIWMYYFKMERASRLLQDLTGGAPTATEGADAPIVSPAGGPPVALESIATISAQAPGKKWLGKLRVGRVFQEAPGVKTFRLLNPLGGVLPISYLPGQFITVAVQMGGRPVKRSYTIASSPTQHDYLEITVKHKEDGEISGFLHNRVQEGDLLEFSGPSGAFTFTGRECKCILLIGGGVGITPLMSVLRFLTDRSWPGDIYLLYCCRKPEDIIFREELEYLQRRHRNVHVVITISQPEGTGWMGATGRITKELITQSVPDLASRYVHVCGPVPLMEGVKKILGELGVPKERIKTEAFGPALGKPEPIKPVAEPATGIALSTVRFALSNKSAPLPKDKPILDVADEIGVEIDNSCRSGICGLCKVKLLSGQVTMDVEDSLTPEDKAAKMILACQAKSTGNVEVEA
jgi:ferredoxin-NADP reductase